MSIIRRLALGTIALALTAGALGHSAASASPTVGGGVISAVPAQTKGGEDLWGWGDNRSGLVGDGTTKQRLAPTRVKGLASVTSITHYTNGTYAVAADGTVWRWGSFYNPTPTDPDVESTTKTPTKVTGLSGVKAIALEQYSGYAVKSDGTVWSWEYLNAPTPVAGLSGVVSISLDLEGCGGFALTRDGTVWEFRCDRYHTGAGVSKLGGVDKVTALTSGQCDNGSNTFRSWYAVRSDGTVWAWGGNQSGQLGDGTRTDRETPVRVTGLTGVTEVTTAACSAYAVTTAGAVWAWGANEGQLGDGTRTDRTTPVRLTALSQVADVVTIGDFPSGVAGYARTTSGVVYYWGCGWPSHYGDSAEKYQRCGKTPVKLPSLTDVREVVPYEVWGGGDSCSFGGSGSGGGYAIKKDGSLWVWGGHADTLSRSCGGKGEWAPGSAVQVMGITGVTGVFPYDSGAYAIGKVPPRTFAKTAAPKITGTAKVGKRLTAQAGAWSPKPSFTYQWLRNGAAITGATKSAYTLTGADAGKKISVKVTGSKSGYKATAKTSAKTKTVAKGTLVKKTPKITGTAKVGRTLTATSSAWGPSSAKATLSYQWHRNGKKIKGATKATYTLTKADKGKQITVKTTGRATGYLTTTSTASKAVKPKG